MRSLVKRLLPLIDMLAAPITLLACLHLKIIRALGLQKKPFSRGVFRLLGIFPVRDYYDEPLFAPRHLRGSLRSDRSLPGMDMNAARQLALLDEFAYQDELSAIPVESSVDGQFFYKNKSFESGDAEYLYCTIRHHKPKRIIEIGSGFSTLMSMEAIRRNAMEDDRYECEMICIEPYPRPWLERMDIPLVRERVENVSLDVFKRLMPNDILFIDSSHMIRPQGDVIYELLEVVPRLNPGVLVHVHDIFTPRDYLDEWIYEDFKFWNEQYLLEALLTHNSRIEVIGALNYLKHHHFNELAKACPVLASQPYREPGSFWFAIR